MFLSAYENNSWKDAKRDWVEDHKDGEVEVVVTKVDGTKLALEHTLIQPFEGEKCDSEKFRKAFDRIENNPDLILPERDLTVVLQVGALRVGYDWPQIGKELLIWLKANHSTAPREGYIEEHLTIRSASKKRPLTLTVPGRREPVASRED